MSTLKSKWDELYGGKALYPEQERQLTIAFYAGAFSVIQMMIDLTDKPDEDGITALDNMSAEIKEKLIEYGALKHTSEP